MPKTISTKKETKSKKTTTKKTEPKKIEKSSKLTWLPKKTFELEITVSTDEVQKVYNLVLEDFVKKTEVKGFRKGKAPANLVEKQVGKDKLLDKTAQELITISYYKAIAQHKLQPIMQPKITPVSMEENKDWIIKAVSCELPDVKLGKYQDAIKGLKAKSAIWTPDKASNEKDEKPKTVADEQIFDELIKASTIEVSDLLIEEETSRLLADMVDQVNAAGLTMQKYLESKKMTQDELKTQYQEFATKSLQLEFALNQVAKENNIEVKQEEVDKMVNSTPDPKIKESLQTPQQQNYIKVILRKQKTIDFLKSL